MLGRTEVSACYVSPVIMPRLTDRSDTIGVGQRGPFLDYPSEDDEMRRLHGFLKRTGLGDYARFFRIGAFLARRSPGNDQVEYVRQFRLQEKASAAASNSKLEGAAHQDSDHRPTETDENIREREREEDRILHREEHREKWFRLHVLSRQNWHVIALVGCCSLGAMIQGWDETAINGGGSYIA